MIHQKKLKTGLGLIMLQIDIKKQMFMTDKERSNIRKHKDSGFGVYFFSKYNKHTKEKYFALSANFI